MVKLSGGHSQGKIYITAYVQCKSVLTLRVNFWSRFEL